jgi:esterase/lipase superfamily enzyme
VGNRKGWLTVTEDPGFQALLADLNGYLARVRSAGQRVTFVAWHPLKVLVATTRASASWVIDPDDGIVRLYGDDDAGRLDHCIVELEIAGTAANHGSRSWRRFFGVLPHKGPSAVVRVTAADPVSAPEFDAVVAAAAADGMGLLVKVHGYANRFDMALRSFATWAHRGGLPRRGIMPLLYSWPAAASKLDYHAQVDRADTSHRPLRELLCRLGRAATPDHIDVLAHSHGGKVVTNLFRTAAPLAECFESSIGNVVLVHPDVSQAAMDEAVDGILRSCRKLVICHGMDDAALSVSSALAGSERVGITGLRPSSVGPGIATRIEQIDTTEAGRGLARHSPRIDAAEVMSDILLVLQDMAPETRPMLEPIEARTARWRIRRGGR